MAALRFGLIGTGYMGKRHAVALQSVGAVFNTHLRPVCELLCSSSAAGAAQKALEFGFNRSTGDWRDVVADPNVDAIIIASIQTTHRDIALAAFEAGKPVLCEKPLGASLDDARAMAAAASASGLPNMVAFNYVRTPATQLAREIISAGEIGDVVHVRAEHNEDFLADPHAPASWRTSDPGSGTLGDLSPHIINTVQRLIGPLEHVMADANIVYRARPTLDGGMSKVGNDDQANLLVRFAGGIMGTISVSRIGTGRKMGYAYEIVGTKGALRFDQEDQNSLWFYDGNARAGREGFTRLLMGPSHPDYEAFCLGPAHGTGYGDQIIIELRDFLSAIETGEAIFPTFADGLEVSRVVAAAFRSNTEKRWVALSEI